MPKFALLLPVTSRGATDVWGNLAQLFASLARTTVECTKWEFDLYVGVDLSDVEMHDFDRVRRMVVASSLPNACCHFATFDLPPGSICRIWAELASSASTAEQAADYYVLLGDDVELITIGWPDLIADAFAQLAATSNFPFGFGCVAFHDLAFPGFPTFPVLHKTHFAVFGPTIFPAHFVNQDADPFVFEVYFRHKQARILSGCELVNRVGGKDEARYVKQPSAVRWPTLLPAALATCSQWLGRELDVISLDVVVPTFRCDYEQLTNILRLPVPDKLSVRFVVVLDNPLHHAVFDRMEQEHSTNCAVRLRRNPVNAGASQTRNRGLSECTGDYVLFLDDDVAPQSDLLFRYLEYMVAHPGAAGFVGSTVLPPPATPRQHGIRLVGCTHFWTIATVADPSQLLPWGITANLCVRRVEGLWFHPDLFPKAGGGEDIDFCIRVYQHWDVAGLVPAPLAVVHHPWWNDGHPHLAHFAGWAVGDGALADLYGKWAFYSVPNLVEQMLLVALVGGWRGAAAAFAADLAMEQAQHGPRNGAQVLLLRTVTELGRLYGHCTRRRLLGNVARRFNWFGDYWPEWRHAERREALWGTARRWAVVGLAWLALG